MNRSRTLSTAAGLGLLAMAWPRAASAQASLALDTDWRRTERPTRSEKMASPQSIAFEARFGPYSPQIDTEPGLRGKPYEEVFGGGAQFYFGFELDWQAARIPWLGVIGPGLGWGYTHRSATAKVTATGQDSGESTSITIFPMYVSAVLRADELMRRTGVPFVPYGKLGFGFASWNTGTSAGASVSNGVAGNGLSYGLEWALGGMLCLNELDERSAASLDQTAGVNHVYLYGEWWRMALDGFGKDPPVMRVGTSTFTLGIAFDM
jgi:hypothetical protein